MMISSSHASSTSPYIEYTAGPAVLLGKSQCLSSKFCPPLQSSAYSASLLSSREHPALLSTFSLLCLWPLVALKVPVSYSAHTVHFFYYFAFCTYKSFGKEYCIFYLPDSQDINRASVFSIKRTTGTAHIQYIKSFQIILLGHGHNHDYDTRKLRGHSLAQLAED